MSQNSYDKGIGCNNCCADSEWKCHIYSCQCKVAYITGNKPIKEFGKQIRCKALQWRHPIVQKREGTKQKVKTVAHKSIFRDLNSSVLSALMVNCSRYAETNLVAVDNHHRRQKAQISFFHLNLNQ